MRNSCKNCKYYIQHYAKCDNGLVEIVCGHCRLFRGKIIRYLKDNICEKFDKIDEETKAEVEITIKKKINYIYKILKNFENYLDN